MDGGSGAEYHLPHFSPESEHRPTKALPHGTHPFKVMNNLIHGPEDGAILIAPPFVSGVF